MEDINFKECEREMLHETARKSVARHLSAIYKDDMRRIAYDMANVQRNPFTNASGDYSGLMEKIVRENDAEYCEYICDIFWEYFDEEWEKARCASA